MPSISRGFLWVENLEHAGKTDAFVVEGKLGRDVLRRNLRYEV